MNLRDLRVGMFVTINEQAARIWQIYPSLNRVGVYFRHGDWPNFYDIHEITPYKRGVE